MISEKRILVHTELPSPILTSKHTTPRTADLSITRTQELPACFQRFIFG